MSEKSAFPDHTSQQQQQQQKFDDDKGLYESSRTDSGFISSGNIIVSGEIQQEEEFKEQNQEQAAVVVVEECPMRLDSGVSLSESFSNLSLKSPGWNDLDAKVASKSFQQEKPKHDQQKHELSWQEYYEQDEDGDT